MHSVKLERFKRIVRDRKQDYELLYVISLREGTLDSKSLYPSAEYMHSSEHIDSLAEVQLLDGCRVLLEIFNKAAGLRQ